MIENITNFSAAALTPLIAGIAIYIAYQQWKTNRLRFKHEMFDRRFEIYKVVQIHLSHILQKGNANENEIGLLLDAYQKSRFLMGKEIQKYIETIYKNSLNLMMYDSQLEAASEGKERIELVEKKHLQLKWLTEQLPILADKFDPYLSLE